jgi:hypothetical protein
MKFLAEYVMRGRLQALLVTLVSASSLLFCWIGAAVVALVTLRKGVAQGAWLLFWALLPAAVLVLVVGDSGPLAMLLGTAAMAAVLRSTVSLPLALLTAVAVGLLTGFAMLLLAGAQLQQLVEVFGEMLAQLERQLASGGEAAQLRLQPPSVVQVAGMLGLVNAVSCALCLLLARYWQAALYNPGGFGDEFRRLHLPVGVTLALVAALVVAMLSGADYRSWAVIFSVPLALAGLALVHAYAAWRGRGTGWMALFYGLWVLFDPVKLLVVLAAIADSWYGFRDRWGGPPAGPDEETRGAGPDDKD